jgi:DNA-binding protein
MDYVLAMYFQYATGKSHLKIKTTGSSSAALYKIEGVLF